jgi:hypothetical protein
MSGHPKHGSFIRLADPESVNNNRPVREMVGLAATATEALVTNLKAYDYLFKDLVADPDNLLDPTSNVIKALKNLGAAMKENADSPEDNSGIPSAYTYLGQFIDHDITREAATDDIADAAFNTDFFAPIRPQELRIKLNNARSGFLDLDSMYDVPNELLENGRFKIGLAALGVRLPNKIDANDLPRKADEPYMAEIGDTRNDDNTIIAQLHVAMLKFHNAVMKKQHVGFAAAQKTVRQHYQWIVIHDFLKRICDVEIVNKILEEGNRIYNPTLENFFMPVEFSAAAYRFGHSMARKVYDYNQAQGPIDFVHLFRFTASSGDLGRQKTLQRDWIIEWEHFLPFDTNRHNKARKIDTRLSATLLQLPGQNIEIFQFLAKRNLLRGYLLNLPTGQALARKILGDEGVLSGEQILDNATAPERAALESANLHIKTPLWYYILVEASIQTGGHRLGKLGSTIVAETIIGLIRLSTDSILKEDNWEPTIDAGFNLEKLIWYANLGPGQQEIEN